MNTTVIPPNVPKPPKNTGLNRRFLWALLVGFFLFLLLVLFLLHHTAPHRARAMQKTRVIHNEAALQHIAKLKAADNQVAPIVVTTTSHRSAPSVSKETPTVSLSKAAMRMAGNAPLLVYHRDDASSHPEIDQNISTKTNHAVVGVIKRTYTLKAGTILPATLLTGIQSDLPGTLIAKIRQDIFDTATGRYLLIPQGSTLIGRYDAALRFGQSRVLIVWSQLIFPNGQSLNLKQLPGVDLTGQAGLHDRVNHHYLRMLSSALLLSLFSTAHQLAQSHSANTLSSTQLLTAAMDEQLSETSMQWIQKNMNVPATVNIRPGANFNVLLTQDLPLQHVYHF